MVTPAEILAIEKCFVCLFPNLVFLYLFFFFSLLFKPCQPVYFCSLTLSAVVRVIVISSQYLSDNKAFGKPEGVLTMHLKSLSKFLQISKSHFSKSLEKIPSERNNSSLIFFTHFPVN